MTSLRHASCTVLVLTALLFGHALGQPPAAPATRPFLMGFTRWPADLSLEGFLTAQDFAHAHGDIVSVMFIGGIPWPESLDGKPFSKDVENNLRYRPAAGKRLFLSISPLNKDRSDLAPYWGEKDNLPLPKPWDRRTLGSGPETIHGDSAADGCARPLRVRDHVRHDRFRATVRQAASAHQ